MSERGKAGEGGGGRGKELEKFSNYRNIPSMEIREIGDGKISRKLKVWNV